MPQDTLTEQQTDRVRQWLREVVRVRGIGRGELATICNVSSDTLRRLLHDDPDRQTPRMGRQTARKVAEGLDVPLWTLIDGDELPPVPAVTPNLDKRIARLEQDLAEIKQYFEQIAQLRGQ